MVREENHLGYIEMSHDYFVSLVGSAATSCFGVVGMSSGNIPAHIFGRKNAIDRGVSVKYVKGKISIDLHIIVSYGVNISAVVKSIMHKVRYTVKEATGFDVATVNVFVDGIKVD